MSLDNTTATEAPVTGSETTTAPEDTGGVLATRFEGIVDPDEQESSQTNLNEGTETQEAGEKPADETEGAGQPEQTVDGDTDQQPDIWAGYEEVEIDGIKGKVPVEFKPFLMKDADYRQKTTAVAVRGRELDAREAQIVERQQLTDQEIGAYVALNQVSEQLKEFEGVDWHTEFAKARVADDPLALGDLTAKHAQFQELRSLQQGGQNFLNEAAKQRTEQAEQATANRITATTEFARKNLAKLGWNEEVAGQVNAWMMKEHGATVDTLRAAYNPQSYSLIYKAFLWDQSNKRQQAQKPANPNKSTPITPTRTVTEKANPNPKKELGDMSEAEFFATRAAEDARRRR